MARSLEKTYEMDLCTGTILPKMLQFALPVMCASMLQLLFNAADIIVVGRWAGDSSMAAVGSNISVTGLLINFFMGLAGGTNILAARFYGAKDQEAMHQIVHTAVLVGLLSGLCLTAAGLFYAPVILRIIKTPPEVLPLATLYLRIFFLGMPASMLYNFGAALLRAVGDTRRPLYYLMGAGVLNVILNMMFVIAFHMDVAGVALATILSQTVSALLVLRCMMRNTGAVHLDLRSLRVYPMRLRQILRLGLPAGVQGMLFSVSNLAIQSSINSFGQVAMAGNTAAGNIEHFVYMSMDAFYQANAAFTSQNFGAGRIERLRPILLHALLCDAVIGLGGGLLATVFGSSLLGLYTSSAAVIAAGLVRMPITCATLVLNGIMDVLVGSIRGLGYSVMPLIVTLCGVCGFRLLWVATVFQMPRFHAITTVYLSYPISWTITGAAHFLCLFFILRRLRAQHAQ